jgi:hypothetical protein
MAVGTVTSGAAQLEFEAASRGSLFNELTAILTGRQRMLLPLDDVVRATGMDGQVDRVGDVYFVMDGHHRPRAGTTRSAGR